MVQEAQVETCCHHWIIRTAAGPFSLGVCQLCSEEREFKNSIDDWNFEILRLKDRDSFDFN